MAKKDKATVFRTVEEYRAYYAAVETKKRRQGSKYYQKGQDIAKMACEKAVNRLSKGQTS